MDNNNDKKLYNLDEIDYKVESDEPDVRGWQVKGSDGKVVGTVDNLLVNKDTEKVVYLDVEVDDSIIEEGHKPLDKPDDEGAHEYINSDGEDHLIIPIGLARLNEDDEYVQCNEIDYQTFASTKRFKKGAPIDSEYEQYVVDRYDEDYDWKKDEDDDFYNSHAFQVSEYRD